MPKEPSTTTEPAPKYFDDAAAIKPGRAALLLDVDRTRVQIAKRMGCVLIAQYLQQATPVRNAII